MKKLLLLAVCCFCVSLVGCASVTSTPYKPALYPEFTGYYDTHFQNDIYEIQFNANSKTEQKRCFDFTLLRSAEVCLEKQYTTFDIISMIDYSSQSTEVYSSAYATVFANINMITNKQNTAVVKKSYPCFIFKIQCYKNNKGYFDAKQIKESIIAKYKTKTKKEKKEIEKIKDDLHQMKIINPKEIK